MSILRITLILRFVREKARTASCSLCGTSLRKVQCPDCGGSGVTVISDTGCWSQAEVGQLVASVEALGLKHFMGNGGGEVTAICDYFKDRIPVIAHSDSAGAETVFEAVRKLCAGCPMIKQCSSLYLRYVPRASISRFS